MSFFDDGDDAFYQQEQQPSNNHQEDQKYTCIEEYKNTPPEEWLRNTLKSFVKSENGRTGTYPPDRILFSGYLLSTSWMTFKSSGKTKCEFTVLHPSGETMVLSMWGDEGKTVLSSPLVRQWNLFMFSGVKTNSYAGKITFNATRNIHFYVLKISSDNHPLNGKCLSTLHTPIDFLSDPKDHIDFDELSSHWNIRESNPNDFWLRDKKRLSCGFMVGKVVEIRNLYKDPHGRYVVLMTLGGGTKNESVEVYVEGRGALLLSGHPENHEGLPQASNMTVKKDDLVVVVGITPNFFNNTLSMRSYFPKSECISTWCMKLPNTTEEMNSLGILGVSQYQNASPNNSVSQLSKKSSSVVSSPKKTFNGLDSDIMALLTASSMNSGNSSFNRNNTSGRGSGTIQSLHSIYQPIDGGMNSGAEKIVLIQASTAQFHDPKSWNWQRRSLILTGLLGDPKASESLSKNGVELLVRGRITDIEFGKSPISLKCTEKGCGMYVTLTQGNEMINGSFKPCVYYNCGNYHTVPHPMPQISFSATLTDENEQSNSFMVYGVKSELLMEGRKISPHDVEFYTPEQLDELKDYIIRVHMNKEIVVRLTTKKKKLNGNFVTRNQENLFRTSLKGILSEDKPIPSLSQSQ